MTRYEPDPPMLRYGITTCVHCGQVPEQHHSDTRCYTAQEIGARLRFHQRTGRWPGPDEGCTENWMSEGWYSCCPTAAFGDAVCRRCGVAVLASPLPPADQILCDRCFDRCDAAGDAP